MKKFSVSENVDTFITEYVSSFQGHDHNREGGEKGNNKGRAISMWTSYRAKWRNCISGAGIASTRICIPFSSTELFPRNDTMTPPMDNLEDTDLYPIAFSSRIKGIHKISYFLRESAWPTFERFRASKLLDLTSCAGTTCHARREFFVPKLQYFFSFEYIQI